MLDFTSAAILRHATAVLKHKVDTIGDTGALSVAAMWDTAKNTYVDACDNISAAAAPLVAANAIPPINPVKLVYPTTADNFHGALFSASLSGITDDAVVTDVAAGLTVKDAVGDKWLACANIFLSARQNRTHRLGQQCARCTKRCP